MYTKSPAVFIGQETQSRECALQTQQSISPAQGSDEAHCKEDHEQGDNQPVELLLERAAL